MLIETLLIASTLLQNAPPLQPLTDQQVTNAIEMGRAGNVAIVQVGALLGASKGDFHVFVEGPVARIAAAASRAFKQYRPFGLNNVTNDMKAPTYRVFVERASGSGRPGAVQHIVLQAKGATGLDGVVQPVREPALGGGAYFDRLPDSDFDVVVATTAGTQRYSVSANERAKIERAAGVASPARGVNTSAEPSVPAPARSPRTALRLFVQGDSKHLAEAIQGLQSELRSAGISGGVVPRGEPYDYTIIFGEGARDAAAAIALDGQGNVAAVVVKGALTEKGAAEGAARDLAKKLAALARQ